MEKLKFQNQTLNKNDHADVERDTSRAKWVGIALGALASLGIFLKNVDFGEITKLADSLRKNEFYLRCEYSAFA